MGKNSIPHPLPNHSLNLEPLSPGSTKVSEELTNFSKNRKTRLCNWIGPLLQNQWLRRRGTSRKKIENSPMLPEQRSGACTPSANQFFPGFSMRSLWSPELISRLRPTAAN
jgi:hypothetical protein